MREKLIEPLEDGLEESELQTNPEGECLGTDIEKFADYLLENGVVVLPYKVGDTLKKEYGYDYNTTDILDEPEVDVAEMNDIMIVSMYDGGYLYSMAVNGRLITDNDDSDDDDPYKIWKAFCYPMDRQKALQIMNEYNVSKVIICEDGGIEIFRKQGDELCKML